MSADKDEEVRVAQDDFERALREAVGRLGDAWVELARERARCSVASSRYERAEFERRQLVLRVDVAEGAVENLARGELAAARRKVEGLEATETKLRRELALLTEDVAAHVDVITRVAALVDSAAEQLGTHEVCFHGPLGKALAILDEAVGRAPRTPAKVALAAPEANGFPCAIPWASRPQVVGPVGSLSAPSAVALVTPVGIVPTVTP